MESVAVRILALLGLAAVAASAALLCARPLVAALDGALKRWRRMGLVPRVVTVLMAAVATVEAQKKCSNVGMLECSNEEGVGKCLNVGMSECSNIGMSESSNEKRNDSLSTFKHSNIQTFKHYFSLEQVITNDSYSYSMPASAVRYPNWWMRGGYEDVFKLELGDWRFPIGTTLVDYLWVYTWGKVRPRLKAKELEIAAVGSPMSAVPQVSEFWYANGTNGSKILTWHNFFVGRVPLSELNGSQSNCLTQSPQSSLSSPLCVSAQLELFPNGDYIARSNLVARYYKRVNPDDWDDDGIPNDIDANPEGSDGENFGPDNDLPEGANSSNYCWVVVSVRNANSLVTFTGDKPSNLPDPYFIAKAGESYAVNLLIGKTYRVTSAQPIRCTAKSSGDIIVDQNDERSMTIVYPVSYEIVDNARSVSRQVRLTPPLVGMYTWNTNTCCETEKEDGPYLPSCAPDCACEGGCDTGGFTFSYEGYSLDFGGVECGCRMIEPEEDEGPYAASASVSFSEKAIIFEDAYENKPGEAMPKKSNRSVLSCVAHGGPNGGRAVFTLANAEKLVRVSGVELPLEVDVPAGHKVAFDIVYEGGEASGSENDVVATAQFIDNEDGDLGSEEDELTVVEVELRAVYVAPENSSQNRHVYGVGEKVNFHISPVLPDIVLNVDRTDKGDHWTQYDTFVGETVLSAADELVYRCPAAGGSPKITITYKNVSHTPDMQVIEPQFVLTTEATGSSSLSVGEVGMGILTTKNYIGPMNVSFQGVRFFEVPCDEVTSPIGYYATTNYTGPISHTKAAGAGYLQTLKSGNYWTIDEAGRDLAYQNWSAGRMEWKIPIGWKRFRYDDDDTPLSDNPDFERNNDITSRPLLIGNRNDMYKQIFEIESNGTSSIRKFGYKLSRSRWLANGAVEKE